MILFLLVQNPDSYERIILDIDSCNLFISFNILGFHLNFCVLQLLCIHSQLHSQNTSICIGSMLYLFSSLLGATFAFQWSCHYCRTVIYSSRINIINTELTRDADNRPTSDTHTREVHYSNSFLKDENLDLLYTSDLKHFLIDFILKRFLTFNL
jgi:hypothetical protein